MVRGGSGWVISDALGVPPNLEWKGFFDGAFSNEGTTQTEKLVPFSSRSQFNFISKFNFLVEPLP